MRSNNVTIYNLRLRIDITVDVFICRMGGYKFGEGAGVWHTWKQWIREKIWIRCHNLSGNHLKSICVLHRTSLRYSNISTGLGNIFMRRLAVKLTFLKWQKSESFASWTLVDEFYSICTFIQGKKQIYRDNNLLSTFLVERRGGILDRTDWWGMGRGSGGWKGEQGNGWDGEREI